MTNDTPAPARQPLGPRQQALVDALRSGDYAQVRSRLHTEDGFCCLGVACDLFNKNGWVLNNYNKWKFEDCSALLPDSVMAYYSFKRDNGAYNKGANALTADNDYGASFHQIAAIIEEHSSELFVEPR